MNKDITESIDTLIQLVHADAPTGWIEFVAYCEIQDGVDDKNASFLCDHAGVLTKIDTLSPEYPNAEFGWNLSDVLHQLWHASGKEWSTAIIRINNSAQIRVKYGFDYHRLNDSNPNLKFDPCLNVIAEIRSQYPTQKWDYP